MVSTSLNQSSSCVNDPLFLGFHIEYVGVPIDIVVVCQNLLSIFIICRSHKLHTNTNMIISSVNAADLLLALTYLYNEFAYSLPPSDSWTDAYILNSFIIGMSYSSSILSASQMAVVAVDRYIYIAHPFYYMNHVTKKLVVTVIACFWCVALVYGLVPVIVYRDTSYHKKCIMKFPPQELFLPWVVVLSCSLVIIVVFYFKVAFLAFSRRKAMHARSAQNKSVNIIVKKRTRAWKSVRFFSIMCGVYFICTVPSALSKMFVNLYTFSTNISFVLAHVFVIHSLLNFGVYARMNYDFRQALQKTFLDVRQCCSGN